MKPADHAKASGTNSTLREIGVALGVAVLTAVFTGAGGTLTPTGYVDAAIPAVWVGAGVLGLAALIALALPSGIRRAATEAGTAGPGEAEGGGGGDSPRGRRVPGGGDAGRMTASLPPPIRLVGCGSGSSGLARWAAPSQRFSTGWGISSR